MSMWRLVVSHFVQMLQDRFRVFSQDTKQTGQERVDVVSRMADQLIAAGHTDAAVAAEWKDGLWEAWVELLELMATRTQILAASYQLHRFYHHAHEALARVSDKRRKIPEELGRDHSTAEALQRAHTAFEHDVLALGAQVGPEIM